MISLDIDARATRQTLSTISDTIEYSVLGHMWRIVVYLQSKIRAEKLHGDPLHQRTGNLSRETLIQPDPHRDGHDIVGTIGTSSAAAYGQIHEYGGTFEIPEHMSMSRLGKAFIVKSHQATYPERSYLRSVLDEASDYIRDQVAQGVAEGLRQ